MVARVQVGDPDKLDLKLTLNGKEMQNSNTKWDWGREGARTWGVERERGGGRASGRRAGRRGLLSDPRSTPSCHCAARVLLPRYLIHSCANIIQYCSSLWTLTPGDLIFTGTPAGVGAARKPPVFLKPGDVVVCDLERLGSITNTIVQEGGRAARL